MAASGLHAADVVSGGEDPELIKEHLTVVLGEASNGRPPTLEPARLEYKSAHNGARLRAYSWVGCVREPRAVVAFVHGFNHQVGNSMYVRIASEMAAEGIACCGVTVEGHGRSSGMPGLVTDVSVLADQVLEFLDIVRAGGDDAVRREEGLPDLMAVAADGDVVATNADLPTLPPGTPFFLLGESMGGAVAVRCADARPGEFAGAVLLSPLCGVSDGMLPNPLLLAIAECLAVFIPSLPAAPVPSTIEKGFNDPLRLRVVQSDTLRYGGRMRIGSGLALSRAARQSSAIAPRLTIPLLIIHSPHDGVCSAQASRRFFDAAGSEDKAYIEVPRGKHALWWEALPLRAAMLADILWFVRTRAEAAVGAAPSRVGSGVVTYEAMPDGPFRVEPGEVFLAGSAASGPPGWVPYEKRPGAEFATGGSLPLRKTLAAAKD